jgi:hypothetical protein
MATEVKHGRAPRFKHRLQPGANAYRVTVTGHYTLTDGVAAAGVTDVQFKSRQEIKRRAELLSLRSAFVGWFLESWLQHGGTWSDGVGALTGYPFDRVRAHLLRHRVKRVRQWGRPEGLLARLLWRVHQWRSRQR